MCTPRCTTPSGCACPSKQPNSLPCPCCRWPPGRRFLRPGVEGRFGDLRQVGLLWRRRGLGRTCLGGRRRRRPRGRGRPCRRAALRSARPGDLVFERAGAGGAPVAQVGRDVGGPGGVTRPCHPAPQEPPVLARAFANAQRQRSHVHRIWLEVRIGGPLGKQTAGVGFPHPGDVAFVDSTREDDLPLPGGRMTVAKGGVDINPRRRTGIWRRPGIPPRAAHSGSGAGQGVRGAGGPMPGTAFTRWPSDSAMTPALMGGS